VSLSPIARVEPGRIETVQALHAGREPLDRSFDDEMEVRAHEAPQVHLPAVASSAPLELGQEVAPIVVVDEERAAAGRERRDVVDAALQHASG
jgi:hypothetical protein